MTKDEQLDAFESELAALVNRYAQEFDLGPDLIGVMERVKLEYWLRWQTANDE